MQDKRLSETVAIDIGLYVQAVASFELELDDLLCLANSRLDIVGLGIKNYPIQITKKLSALPIIAQAVSQVVFDERESPFLAEVLAMRQSLVHGRVIAVSWDRQGYELTVSKMGLPNKSSGKTILTREPAQYHALDFLNRALELQDFSDCIEVLRKAVFRAGDGWPTYLVLPEGDPLGLKILVDRFRRYSTENAQQV
jgi:hypothetical protein